MPLSLSLFPCIHPATRLQASSIKQRANPFQTQTVLVRRVTSARRLHSQSSPTKSTKSQKSQPVPALPPQFQSATYPPPPNPFTKTTSTSPTKSRYTTASPSPLQQSQIQPQFFYDDEKTDWPMPPARETSIAGTTTTRTGREMSISSPLGMVQSSVGGGRSAGAGGGWDGVPTLFPPPPGRAGVEKEKEKGKWWRWMVCWR